MNPSGARLWVGADLPIGLDRHMIATVPELDWWLTKRIESLDIDGRLQSPQLRRGTPLFACDDSFDSLTRGLRLMYIGCHHPEIRQPPQRTPNIFTESSLWSNTDLTDNNVS